MSWFRVVAVNEDKRPVAQVTVEAIDLTDRSVSATAVTNRSGEALFTGLTGPHFFRPHLRRTSGSVGDRSYTGHVEIQVVGFNTNCMDYTVDADGGGTHTTLASAVSDAITAASTSGTITIWLCDNVTEGSIDIGGLGSSATIIITSPDRYRVSITAPGREDIFEQTTTGGNSAGRLILRRVGLVPDVANTKSVFSVQTASEVTQVLFEECDFNGSYLLTQTSLNSMGGILLRVVNCTGSLAGFYLTTGASATLAPDNIEGFGNRIALTRWWHSSGTASDPNFARFNGGFYSVANGLAFADGDQFHWSSMVIHYTGSGAAFSTGGATTNIKNLSFVDLVMRFADADGVFGNFNSAGVNNNDGLFIKDVFGFPISGLSMTAAATFLTVNSNYQNVHIGNIFGNGFDNQYSGPASGGYAGDHGSLGGLTDDDHSVYLLLDGRSGGQVAIGGTDASDTLDLQSTSHATKGSITIEGDANFNFSLPSSNPRITLDSNDYLEYNRAGNYLSIFIGSAELFKVSATAVTYKISEVIFSNASQLSTFSKYRAAAGDQILDFDFDNLQAGEDARLRFFRNTTSAGGDDRVTFYSPGTSTVVAEMRMNAGLFILQTTGSGAGLQIGGDTHLYRSAANVLSLATGDSLDVIDLGGLSVASDLVYGGKMIRKSADETVTSSTTLQNDDELVFAVDANEEWVFTIVVFYSSTSNAGFKFNFTLPTGAVGWKSLEGTGIAAGGGDITTERDAALDVGSVYVMHCAVEVGANAGNVQFQWCQSTSHSDSTTVKEHSILRAYRVA